MKDDAVEMVRVMSTFDSPAVVGVIGIGGQGKSALVSEWLHHKLESEARGRHDSPRPDGPKIRSMIDGKWPNPATQAGKIPIDPRTLSKALKGEAIVPAKLQVIAEALDQDAAALIRNPPRFIERGDRAPLLIFEGRRSEFRQLDDAIPAFRHETVVAFSAYRFAATFSLFLEFVLNALGEDPSRLRGRHKNEQMASRLAGLLREQHVLLVIDGLERWLWGWQGSDDPQSVTSGKDREESRDSRGLDHLLSALAALTGGSHVVFTSRVLPVALENARIRLIGTSVDARAPSSHRLAGLSEEEGVILLGKLGLQAPKETLSRLVKEFDGHPLALTLVGKGLITTDSSTMGEQDPLERLLATVAGEGTSSQGTPSLGAFDHKLGDLFAMIEKQREAELPILRAAALCIGDTPVDAIRVVLDLPADNISFLRARLVTLENWGLVELYRLDSDDYWVGLHPLVKRHFHASILDSETRQQHRLLSEYFSRMPIPDDARTLIAIQPRLWAIEHAAQHGDFDRCCDLISKDIVPGMWLSDWFVKWGYHEFELELEKHLEPKVSRSRRLRLLRSIITTLTQMGRLADAQSYLKTQREVEQSYE